MKASSGIAGGRSDWIASYRAGTGSCPWFVLTGLLLRLWRVWDGDWLGVVVLVIALSDRESAKPAKNFFRTFVCRSWGFAV